MHGSCCLAVIWLFAATAAWARPAGLDAVPRTPPTPTPEPAGFVSPAAASAFNETLFFGGTTWAPDSMRWEAIQDSVWTFETGVGSAIKEPGHTVPGVDPFKPDGFHASMEGWVGIDFTRPNPAGRMRRLAASDPRWGPDGPCVGTAGGLGGEYSLWAGLLPDEADSLCYAGGRGYGNWWKACVARSFNYAGTQAVTLEYDYRNETEETYDFSRVVVESQAGSTEFAACDGFLSGHETLTLSPGNELPSVPGAVRIVFCAESDETWSDEDGGFVTDCGPFALDNIALSGGLNDTTDFEADDGGWVAIAPESIPGPGGEWSRLMAVDGLPPIEGGTTGTCALGDSVLVLFDPDTQGHPLYQDDAVVSPWIDLKRAGAIGYPGYVVHVGGHHFLDYQNFIFIAVRLQWYPYQCPATGTIGLSPWTSTGFFTNFSNNPICTDGDIGFVCVDNEIPADAEGVRLAVGVINLCRYFPTCTGTSNTTPWLDNLRFCVRTVNTLHSVVDAAAEGDTVWIPPGTYSGAGNRDVDFHGKGIVLIGSGGADQTIIDCERRGRGFLFQSGEDSTSVVQGFTVRNGLAPRGQYGELEDGGGVFVTGNSRPRFRDCVVESCEAGSGGGVGTDPDNSGIDLISCRLTGNAATTGGGVAGVADLRTCLVDGNTAQAGGGLYLFSGSVKGTEVAGNHATQDGGGAMLVGGLQFCTSSAVMEDCTIHGNSSDGDAGGVENCGHLRRCVIQDNTAAGVGGGVSLGGGEADSCAISDNSAHQGGGVAWIQGIFRSPTINACSLTGNRADEGGGGWVWADGLQASWTGCTMAGNRATSGGGLFLVTGSQLDLTACILWGNGADGYGNDAYLQGTNTFQLECCASDPQAFYGGGSVHFIGAQVHENPVFCGAVAWPAAPTADGVYALAANSPCLPANNACGVLIGAQDQGCATTGIGGDVPGLKPGVAAYPNPFTGNLHVAFTGPEDAATASVEIFDVRGRLVWGVDLPGGSAELDWNGRDPAGGTAAPGVYFVHVRAGSLNKSARVVMLR